MTSKWDWADQGEDRWALFRDVQILPTDSADLGIKQRHSIEEGDKKGHNITMFAFANDHKLAEKTAKRHMKKHPRAQHRH